MINQKISIFFLNTLLFLGISGFAQKHTTIVFRYNQDSIKQEALHYRLKKSLDPNVFGESVFYVEKLISFNKKKGYSETIYSYEVKDTACGYISDGFGHPTFVIPGDTMIINVKGKIPRTASKPFMIPWFNYMSFEGKNKFVYSLFDSLTLIAGDPRFNFLHYSRKDTLNQFCKKAASVYSHQVSFLEKYCKSHKIGIPFKKLALSEVFGTYITNLLKPLESYDTLTLNEYPKPYRDIILNCKFIDPYNYFNNYMYSNATYEYSEYVLPKQKVSKNGDVNRNLNIIYNSIKLNLSDSIRNHLLTRCLSGYILNPKLILPSLDSLLTDFNSISQNKLYTRYLDSLLTKRKALGVKVLKLNDAMSSQIMDTKEQLFTVKQLFKTKPLLIICWASWCAPCLREIPSEKALQNIYVDKVDFVYLSFDSNKNLWTDKLQTISIKDDQNYLLMKFSNSDLANFYKINSIPYYLLYDKNGNKVEIKELRPSDEGFKSVLDKLLN